MQKAIVCIGGFWDGFSSRRQHFMTRFADRGVPVLFVEPSQSWNKLLSSDRLSPVFKPRTRRVKPGLTVLTPTMALPFRHGRLPSLIDHSSWSRQIRHALDDLGLTVGTLWIYDPRYSDAVRFLEPDNIVFDMVDDYILPEYGGRRLRPGTEWLLGNADLCVFTSPVLEGKYGARTRCHSVIPNGFDSLLFNTDDASPPADWPFVTGPVIGFAGTLFKHVDFELLARAAELARERNGELLLIGKTDPDCTSRVESVVARGGRQLGHRPHAALPAYMKRFSLCLAPFVSSKVSASVSPLKVYEYLACGRPVYATGLDSLRQDPLAAAVLYAPEFTLEQALEHAIEFTSEESRALSLSVAGAEWGSRFATLLKSLSVAGISLEHISR
ncbi:glycosyltransferase family 1 protein [Candidatus Fermentibacteria bacterium]|nr:glycosyltransferase family 1 protein [Candidatus Fermentibacteria bacterium]